MPDTDEIHVGVCRALVDATEEKGRLGLEPTLRDRFAMAALQGALASDPHTKLNQITTGASEWAECAYALADAMLVARGPKRIADSEFEEASP